MSNQQASFYCKGLMETQSCRVLLRRGVLILIRATPRALLYKLYHVYEQEVLVNSTMFE